MNNQEKRAGSSLSVLLQAITALGSIVTAFVLLVAVAQYWQSEKQSMSNAAITFIQIHNNDDFYDARRDILDSVREVNFDQNASKGLTDDQQVYLDNLGKDFLIAKQRAGRPIDPIDDLTRKYDAIGLSLVQLYDAVAKCMNDDICLYDTSEHHFRGMSRLILLSFKSSFPQWREKFENLGDYACALAEQRIVDRRKQATVLDSLFSLIDRTHSDPEGTCRLINLQARPGSGATS
jgi:hypothetical protein